MKNNFLPIILTLLLPLTLISCSFVELLPGDHRIIYANNPDSCKKLKELVLTVKTTTFFISRSSKAIAEELQILAQNEAIRSYANAIWPVSEVKDGQQSFSILRCSRK